MKLEKGKSYFLKINHFGRHLDYEGKVISIDKDDFSIRTLEDCKLDFRVKDIISFKEIEEKKLDENKVFVIKKKGPLKEGHKPKGL